MDRPSVAGVPGIPGRVILEMRITGPRRGSAVKSRLKAAISERSSMSRAGEPFASDAIIIDPVVPVAARYSLEQRWSQGARKGARSTSLLPFRQAPPPLPPPPAHNAARRSWQWAACVALCLGVALSGAAAGSVVLVVVFLIGTGVATALSTHSALDASASGQATIRERWHARHATAFYHRRYIVPPTDLDENVRSIWARAIAAANQIRDSDVVRRHLIDSAEATAHLPQRLWEIAEGLARLSLARSLQREILRQGRTDGQQVAAKVNRQGREMDLAAATIEERVRRLEDSASLVKKADEVTHMEATLGRLGEVDELLLDLRASTPDARPDLDPAERLRLEVQAVIDQASEAVRSLAYPGADGLTGP
jgi:hypothetical protein